MSQRKRWVQRLTKSTPGHEINYGGKSFTTAQRSVELATQGAASSIQRTSTSLFESYGATYAYLYQTQPNARTVVDFIARNVAQLSIKAYDRVGEAERKHLPDHPAEQVLKRPNPYSTEYRFKRDIVSDLAIYDNAFVIKLRLSLGGIGLVRVPPSMVSVEGKSPLHPDSYVITTYANSGQGVRVASEDVIHFRGYDPTDGRAGYPPFETLRRVLAQDEAADRHMEGYWQHAPRREGVITRSLEAGDWSDEAADRFRKDLANHFAGGANAGVPLVLEDGMQWSDSQFDPKTVQWSEGRKLNLETICRAYHIPVAMLMPQGSDWGVDKYHEMLYMDTLAPTIVMLQEELNLQLLPEFEGASSTVYLEFNMDEKLRGDFETRHAVLSTAVGSSAYMTVNEARAILNLPKIDGGDELRTVPGSAPAGGSEMPIAGSESAVEGSEAETDTPVPPAKSVGLKALGALRDDEVDTYARDLERGLRKTLQRQRDAHRPGKDYDIERWNRELSDDLYALSMPIVDRAGRKAAEQMSATFLTAQTEEYVAETSRIRAEKINGHTAKELSTPEAEPDKVYDDLLSFRTLVIAATAATALSNFATHEAAKQSGGASKTWVVTSARSRHPHMNGETVKLDERFSNGAMWPGDPTLTADETASCQCLLSFDQGES